MPPYLLTAPGPALYAASASCIDPNWFCRPERYFAAPLMADDGSYGLMPSPAAVVGMNCISPSAPAEETALGLNPASCEATAASTAGSIPYCAPACWNRFA